MDIISLTALELREKVKNKEISAREVVSAHLDRIKEKESKINAFITVTVYFGLSIFSNIKNSFSLRKTSLKNNSIACTISTKANFQNLEYLLS